MSVVVSQLVGRVSIEGIDQAQNNLKQVGSAASTLGEKLSTIKPYNAGTAITDVDVAAAKLTLLESQVTQAHEKLQTLQNAADAGQAVKGIPEAEANLTLLQEKAQNARAGLEGLLAPAEEASAGLQQVDSGSQEASSGLASLFTRLQETTSEMSQGFLSRVKETASNLSGNFFGGIKSAATGLFDFTSKIGFAAQGIQTMYQSAIGLGKALLEPNASMEQTQVAFKGLLGSSSAAAAELKDLQQFAASTPFQFPELADSTQKLLAFQFSLKDTRPLLTAIGDSLSALGEGTPAKLSQVVDVFGQMNAAGKLQTQDLMQLTSVGINGFQLLSDQMHKPVSVIKDMVTSGTIPASQGIEMLRQGMEKTFGGGMAAQAQTFNGLLSTFQDNIGSAWRAFTGPLFDQAKTGLQTIGTLVSSPVFQTFATTTGQAVMKAFTDIGSALQSVGHFLLQVKDNWQEAFDQIDVGAISNAWQGFVSKISAGGAVFKMILPLINNISNFIALLVVALAPLLPPLIRIAGEIGHGVAEIFKAIASSAATLFPKIDALVASVVPLIARYYDAVASSGILRQAFDDIKLAIKAATDILSPLLDDLSSLFDWLTSNSSYMDILKDAVHNLLGFLKTMLDDLGNLFQLFSDNTTKAQLLRDALLGIGAAMVAIKIGSFLASLPALIVGFLAWAGAAGAAAVATIAATWPILAIGAGIALVVAGIILAVQHWGEISKWLTGVWKNVASFFVGLWQNIQAIFGVIGEWFRQRWAAVVVIFDGIGAFFHQKFTDAWNSLVAVFARLGEWFRQRWAAVVVIFDGIGAFFHQKFTDAWNSVVAVFAPIGSWFRERWASISTALAPVISYIGAVFQTIWNIIVALFGIAGRWFHDRWLEIAAVFANVGRWFHDRFVEAWSAISSVFGKIGQWFHDRFVDITVIFGKIGQWFHDRFVEIWSALVSVLLPIGRWFQDRYKDATAVFSKIGQWFHDRFVEIWSALLLVLTPIGQWFRDRYASITVIFGKIGQWFHDRFTDAWNSITSIFGSIGKWFQDRWNDVLSGVNSFKDNIVKKFTDVKTFVVNVFHDLINGIVDKLNDGIATVENFINFFGQGLDNIAKALGTEGTIPVAHLPRIPHYEKGTDASGHPGGAMIVGEKGPELLVAPKGTKILPHDKTMQLLMSSPSSIPGYANGIGDILGNIGSWIGSGAKGIVDMITQKLGLHLSLPGGLASIGSGILNSIKQWAVSFVSNLLPKFDMSGDASSAPGNVTSWIKAAMTITGAPGSWLPALTTIAMHESGGNPNAQNNTDINAQNGDPSRGLFQTIGATFAAYALPGYSNIFSPIDDSIAGIRYIQARYGDVFHVPGIESLARGGPYVGYANGTDYNPVAGNYLVGERGAEIMHIPRGASVVPHHRIDSLGDSKEILSRLDRIATLLEGGLTLDGQRLTRAQMPYIVNAIANSTGFRR